MSSNTSSNTEFENPRGVTRETTDDARQAVAPHTVRYMLAIGLAGVIAAFAIIYFIFV